MFVISSSQVGAKEKDTRNAIELMSGPNVRHYWDGQKRAGAAVQPLIEGLEDPAWDFWMLYAPGATWAGNKAPEPDWWEHNLWALGRSHADRRLNADRFAAKAQELSRMSRRERAASAFSGVFLASPEELRNLGRRPLRRYSLYFTNS